MAFFQQAITVLQTLVIALGAGLCVWGGINLMEGYGNDNPGAKSQGIKHDIAAYSTKFVMLCHIFRIQIIHNSIHCIKYT